MYRWSECWAWTIVVAATVAAERVASTVGAKRVALRLVDDRLANSSACAASTAAKRRVLSVLLSVHTAAKRSCATLLVGQTVAEALAIAFTIVATVESITHSKVAAAWTRTVMTSVIP